MKMQNVQLDKHLLLQFKSGLQEQARELLHTIEKTEKEIRDSAGPVPRDAIDLSSCTASMESLFAGASRNCSRLRLVQRALERITDGSFGTCVDCGDPIGLKRLQAVPWAGNCIHCQEQAEVARLGGQMKVHTPRHDGVQTFSA